MTEGKKTRRNNKKYAALDPSVNLKSRIDNLDYDYLHKLSDEEKMWLNNFTEEYVHANMEHKGQKFHKTKKLQKDCYDRNNARNRDILTRAKITGTLTSFEDIKEKEQCYEDRMIELIENLNKLDDTNKRTRKKRKSTKKL